MKKGGAAKLFGLYRLVLWVSQKIWIFLTAGDDVSTESESVTVFAAVANSNRFLASVKSTCQEESIPLQHVYNMDETPVWFDMPMKRTIEKVGCKSVAALTTGNYRKRFTVVLCCSTDGTKLPPAIIGKDFAGRQDESLESSVTVYSQKGSSMTTELMVKWLQDIYLPHINQKKSLLILDSFAGHKAHKVMDYVKDRARTLQTRFIPPGFTAECQPLDISANKSFKIAIRKRYREWISQDDLSTTRTGNLRKPSLGIIAKWVRDAWDSVPASAIRNGFRKARLIG